MKGAVAVVLALAVWAGVSSSELHDSDTSHDGDTGLEIDSATEMGSSREMGLESQVNPRYHGDTGRDASERRVTGAGRELEQRRETGSGPPTVSARKAGSSSRYAFFRSMSGTHNGSGGTRRVFGGASVPLSEYPAACALLDRYWTSRCSGAVVARRWVLTAAHCVTPHVAYVKYNARRPGADAQEGSVVAVHYLYRHPNYKVVQQDEGRGMDVTLLHHDVGLVRTRADLQLSARPPPDPLDPLRALRRHDLRDLLDQDVQVLGFGRTEDAATGEELFAVRLRLVGCERAEWRQCMCGVAEPGGEPRGVCSGDSGGPVLYRGAQVGVTSMGPLECASARAQPSGSATSVFTALQEYAPVINATILDMEEALRMRMISRATLASPAPCAALTWLVSLVALVSPAV